MTSPITQFHHHFLTTMNPLKLIPFSPLLFLLIHLSNSLSTISPNQSLQDGQTLISSGQKFALGFFSPGNSSNRYLGIWYHQVSELTIVWVANRNNPINHSSGILSISTNGNLVISGSNRSGPVWSTNFSISPNKIHSAEILDSGNLILFQQDKRRVLWESFDYPSNTYLPYMKLGLDRKTGLNRFLTSWKSPEDPGTGNCSYKFDFNGFPQLFLYKGSVPFWRVGSWTGLRWSGVPEMTRNYIFKVSYVNDENEIMVMYEITNSSILSRMVLDDSGVVHRLTWNGKDRKWIEFWWAPKERCDYFSRCGSNSYCDPYYPEEFECKCLVGFEPKWENEWYLRDGSGGCVRKGGAGAACGAGEGFVKVTRVKVPDTSFARVDMGLGLKECKEECLRNCSCSAYSVGDESKMIGCLMWFGELVDMRKFSDVGQDLYVRVDAETLAQYSKKINKKMVEVIVIPVAITLFLLVAIVYWSVRKKRKAWERRYKSSYNFTSSTFLEESLNRDEFEESRKNSELSFFNLSTIVEATNNFSDNNKLGQGGFGLVYKGVLGNGHEIAIKRLSKFSGQGVEEFKNEIVLIAKLQHRNLVRILGYCIEGKEKMLIYEYLPNKSLDAFLFDETRRAQLDWQRRFDIVLGIARGILYLHQDSRLRIIHRDLKASNVLLDSSMNPKISDFGMARMFGGDETEGNTNRVVGTYGYMSPEYAMEGQFSVKSDVYSFGVLLLEIVTGRKNSGYIHDCPLYNLIGYVWELWKDGKTLEAVDPLMGDSYSAYEVSRCIEIGLLCLQEYAQDRPNMSEVIFMLANSSTLPCPKQPAFIFTRKKYGGEATTSASEGASSVNDVTVTMIDAR